MAHRVLEQRLQDQAWHQRVERPRLERHLCLQSIAESRAFDLEIALDHAHFVAQRDQLRAFAEHVTQQVAQRQQHPERRLDLAALRSSDDDVVERVEEKVRIELLAERVEPRLGDLGAQALGHFGLPAARLGHREADRDRPSTGTTSGMHLAAAIDAPSDRRSSARRSCVAAFTTSAWDDEHREAGGVRQRYVARRGASGADRRTCRSMNGATSAHGYHCAAP